MDSAGRAATDRSLEILLAQDIRVEIYHYASSAEADPDTYIREVGADSARAPIIGPFERFVAQLLAAREKDILNKVLKKFQPTPFTSYEEQQEQESEARKKIAEAKSRIPKLEKDTRDQLYPFEDFLINRSKALFDLSKSEGKLQAVNFLLPYVQRIPNPILRSEWASRIAQQLRIEEPVLRESMRKAASERRSEVKARPELIGRAGKPAERRLVQMLIEAEGFRVQLAQEILQAELHRGLETERILSLLVETCQTGARPDAASLAQALEERDRRLLFEIAFEAAPEPSWEEAEDCLRVLRLMQLRPRLAALKTTNLQQLPHEQVLAVQGKIQELQALIAKLEGTLERAQGA
jgi:DNA primase